MRKQMFGNNSVRAARWAALKKVPGGLPLLIFTLLVLVGATGYFTAMGIFCLGRGDGLWALFALGFAFLMLAVALLGLLSVLWQDRYPRFYRFMWTEK